MKRTLWIILLLLLACVVAGGTALAEQAPDPTEEPEEELAEWTLLFYFCGSDLESRYGYASAELETFKKLEFPCNSLDYLSGVKHPFTSPGKINMLIETGGSKKWNGDLGISADALQRWKYDCLPPNNMLERPDDGFKLMETLPLRSMGDPETLTDFIRWGVQTCPAKRFALVLWDHGGGAKTGMFIDELFDKDMMYLYELRQALDDAGVQFEAVIIDACLMANLETAWSLKNHSRWLVASEENIPGNGTAMQAWLQALIANPDVDGKMLCRWVCDMTAIEYANGSDELAKSLLTWSVIDLSKVDRVVAVVTRFLDVLNDAMRNDINLAALYAYYLYDVEEFGDGQQQMKDLADVANDRRTMGTIDLAIRSEMQNAISEAVVYTLRGPGRSAASGLSFCYPSGFNDQELEEYAKNCPLPQYLAYLDAISEWEAPSWVYEQVEPVPEINDLDEFRIYITRYMKDGMPGLLIEHIDLLLNDVFYRLYRLDEETGNVLYLGRTDCGLEMAKDFQLMWRASDPMHWPAVDGALCCIDLIQDEGTMKLYNIPVQINSQTSILRCGRNVSTMLLDDGTERVSEYEIYGVWEGFDAHSELLNRSVKPLAMLAGQEFSMLYPVDKSEIFQPGPVQKMYRSLEVSEIPLPPGTYYLEYEVDDSFRRTCLMDRIEIHWDGENISYPEGFTWEGKVTFP